MDEELIERIAEAVVAKFRSAPMDMLTVEEAAEYIGVRKSYIYTLTSTREIPYYKPGKKVLIRRVDLDAYITDKRVKPMREIRSEAIAYCDSRSGSKSSMAKASRGRAAAK